MLHNAKEELLMQVSNFDIVIDARGFFNINRQFIASVSKVLMNWPQLLSNYFFVCRIYFSLLD